MENNISFTAYLIQPFQNTHENIFFRTVANELRKKYNNEEGKSVLIGNLSCGGHLLDAIFISLGKIIIIDFKDYEGKLKFSENNPWRIYRNNDFTFVAGGGGIRNPYQQLNAYRFSLMDVLSSKQDKILSPNHLDVRWDHINCMVLFHRQIQFNYESIPNKINRFFSIADQNTYLNTLQDRYSQNLNLNDNEIENILAELDVRPENLFTESNEPQISSISQINDRGARLEFVKRHTKDVLGLNEGQKILEYYRTILNLEKFKESKSENLYRYGINLQPVTDQFLLDISSNQHFYPEYLENGQQQFPQNIFIGINVIENNEAMPLLQNIILRADIEDPENIIVRVSDFNIYSKVLEDKGLSEDIIDDLVTSLNESQSLLEKIEIVKNKLDWDIRLANHISVGLSNESPFNAQAISELKSIIRFNNYQEHTLFYDFLRNERVSESIADFNFAPLIFITQLNYSQRRSVRLAFSQPLTVITGPPGTGKTQVVLNLIANAIVNNQTVLFASKNNKAVDNVRIKLQNLLREGSYILRFGTKAEVRDKTKPTIEKFINQIQHNQIEDHRTESKTTKSQCENLNNNAKLISDQLKMIIKLKKEVKEVKERIKNEADEYAHWINSLDGKMKELFLDKNLILDVSKNDLAGYIVKLKSIRKNSLIKLFFKLFLKNKYFRLLINIQSKQRSDIKKFIERNNLVLNPQKDPLESYLDYLEFLFNLKTNNDVIEEKYKSHTELENSLKNRLTSLEMSLAKYKSKESGLREELNIILNQMPSAGIEYLNEFINQKLFDADLATLQDYIDYIPDKIPWKQEKIPDFVYANQQFLSNFNSVIVTNLSVKNGFSLSSQMFDLVVVDEASQCDVASALPLLFRAKKFVVIGDPLQLTHITKVKRYEEEYILEKFNIPKQRFNYVDKSLYKFCENLTMRSKYESVFLNEHFRSHTDIISYSKRNFYLPKLGQDLIIKTQPELFRFEPKGITWKNVRGQIHRYRNENASEIETCVNTVVQLFNENPDASIGITTPYKHQAAALRSALPQNLRDSIIADTVHKFQGDERDIMILSLVLCSGTDINKANWINYKVPYLLNVAVTRARSALIIVGDFNYCRSLTQRGPSPLSQLANYVFALNRVKDL
ncbi:MAG: DNA2/NAM7 family helicase [Bacteroidetes bacterium]|nr:DNA2/NAM7 family helicase [Bacteroidota bacterium]